MSRAVRITVGSVVATVLAFVAIVATVMSVAGAGAGARPDGWGDWAGVDTPATAEVLDVDDSSWPTVDVRWTTAEGEVVVTYVDWEWGELPEVGDEVGVLYDAADPEFAYAADDPYVAGALDDPAGAAGTDGGAADEGEGEDAASAADTAPARTAGWVALAALAGLVVTVVVTVVAAVRAPAPPPQAHLPSVYEAPFGHLATGGHPGGRTAPYPLAGGTWPTPG